jgi:hypothetical protein
MKAAVFISFLGVLYAASDRPNFIFLLGDDWGN